MWIGGEWVDAESGETFPSINPATGEEIARVPLAGKGDVKKAIEAAKKAFPKWSKEPQGTRSNKVLQLARLLRERVQEFAELETRDHGSPIRFNLHAGAAECFEWFAKASSTIMGNVLPVGPHMLAYTQREPIGVVSLLVPWNGPLEMLSWKLGPALAVGNACVVKPSSFTSLTALKLGELLEQLDLPPGTVNIVTGPPATIGEELTTNPDVRKVGLTGSTATGREVMASAAKTVKRLSLELGGKNPFIVFDDADIDAAIMGAIEGSFWNSGQVCASVGRYYIHEKVYEEFVEKFISAANKIVMGDPLDIATDMGPLVSEQHRDKVAGLVKSGLEEGAKLVLGGERPSKPPLDKGWFFPPTIFTKVTQNMRIAREEIFGPVAPILKFSSDKSDEEVIELANDSTYGLVASVWTSDMRRALKFVNALESGMVWVNDHMGLGMETPVGGFKESGFGKDLSHLVFDDYTQIKCVMVELTGMRKKPFGKEFI